MPKHRITSIEAMERVCALWAQRKSLHEISIALELRQQTILKWLRIARQGGDMRAAARRNIPSRQITDFLDVLEQNQAVGATVEFLAENMWPHGKRPKTWRSVLAVVANRAREFYGARIRCEDKTYYLMGYEEEATPNVPE